MEPIIVEYFVSSPGGTLREDPDHSVQVTPGETAAARSPAGSGAGSSRRRQFTPCGTATARSPAVPVASTSRGRGKKCRRSLALKDTETVEYLRDSGSDGETEDSGEESADEAACQDYKAEHYEDAALYDIHVQREVLSQLRDNDGDGDVWFACEVLESNEEYMEVDSVAAPSTDPEDPSFVWSDDYESFTGQRETFLRDPGPIFSCQDPTQSFIKIWHPEFMETIVKETNRYAWQTISMLSDPDVGRGIPKYFGAWVDVTVEELYVFFAMLINMSFCLRTKIPEYWTTGVMAMPGFGKIMSRDRFRLINKFLHFADNDALLTRGRNRKVEKIAPVVEHCNRMFSELYTPSQYLSLDESLLLWKGRLSWKQCIRTKAARFGIKSFELCESTTGYLLQYRLYTGKSADSLSVPCHGFTSHAAKVVLDLLEGYLNVGHTVVMDNWYNQLDLTRYLKSQRTDVLGTLNRCRKGVPQEIKDIKPSVKRGTCVSRHSGDISLVAWQDVKLVTVLSTYHKHELVKGRRAGQTIKKPVAVRDYNLYMGGVDLKDQKLSGYLMERKRARKWYMKVFKRLLNTSILNAYIIYTRNPMYRVYSHRQFRMKVAEGLVSLYAPDRPTRFLSIATVTLSHLRLQPGMHFPEHTEVSTTNSKKGKRKQLRCVRCVAQRKRADVTLICAMCKVPLCVGQCWRDYHTLEDLS